MRKVENVIEEDEARGKVQVNVDESGDRVNICINKVSG